VDHKRSRDFLPQYNWYETALATGWTAKMLQADCERTKAPAACVWYANRRAAECQILLPKEFAKEIVDESKIYRHVRQIVATCVQMLRSLSVKEFQRRVNDKRESLIDDIRTKYPHKKSMEKDL
jgi:hypothetical protein